MGDVVEPVAGLDAVVTGVDVTVVLEDQRRSTGPGMDAHADVIHPEPVPSAVSNIWTDTCPTSRRTHASKTPTRKLPNCAAEIVRCVT